MLLVELMPKGVVIFILCLYLWGCCIAEDSGAAHVDKSSSVASQLCEPRGLTSAGELTLFN